VNANHRPFVSCSLLPKNDHQPSQADIQKRRIEMKKAFAVLSFLVALSLVLAACATNH
jgi:hypothetical protein